MYEKTRAAAVTTPRAAVAPTPSEPTGNASVQAELSFDQFVERFKRLSRQYYGNEENEPISISKFSEKAQRALLDVSTRVQSKLTSSGVTLDPPIELTPDSTGSGVRVGLHPLRAKIQALLNEDASLSSEYRDAMLMHAEATQWQRVEKAHLAYYAAYDSGNVNEANEQTPDHRTCCALSTSARTQSVSSAFSAAKSGVVFIE